MHLSDYPILLAKNSLVSFRQKKMLEHTKSMHSVSGNGSCSCSNNNTHNKAIDQWIPDNNSI